MRNLFFLIILFFGNICLGQHYSNPENAMLSDSISSFFYYSTNPNGGFSNPGSLRDTERRSRISDNYHDESEKLANQYRQQMIQQQQQQYRQNPYMRNQGYYNPYGVNQYINYSPVIIIRQRY
jgi:hypothetical protein